jgi:hypothetical protein
VQCRQCEEELTPERAALGYDYCTRPECVEACFEPVDVVALGVNKAADQYLLRRHLDIPEPTARTSGDAPDDSFGALNLVGKPPTARSQSRTTTAKSTAAKIAALEAELDAALACEQDPAQRRKLVDDHNARLRQLNIRYRRTAQRQT